MKKFDIKPTLDAFADEGTRVLERWWGKGGEKENAWKESWDSSKHGCLWMNPPLWTTQGSC